VVASPPHRPLTLLLAVALLPLASLSAQRKDPKPEEPPPSLADLQAFELWLADYKAGAFRLVKDGETDFDAVKQVDATMTALAKWGDLMSARKLFEAAWVMPVQAGNPSATERIDFHREVQPFRVQAMADGSRFDQRRSEQFVEFLRGTVEFFLAEFELFLRREISFLGPLSQGCQFLERECGGLPGIDPFDGRLPFGE
jgi:hypothetical protein